MNNENQYDIHKYNEIEIPKGLNDAVKSGLIMGNKLRNKKKRKKNIIKWASAAAAVIAVCSILVSNPVLATKIPLLGHVFSKLQESYVYQGDYSSVAISLTEENTKTIAEDQETTEELKYTKESGGARVSISEVYCNDQAIYLAMTIEDKEGLPAQWIWPDGNVKMDLETEERYSFNPSKQKTRRCIDGKMLDEYTFAGILRISLDEINTDDSEAIKALGKGKSTNLDIDTYEHLIKKVDVPESFMMNFEIKQILGYTYLEETKQKTDEDFATMSAEEMEDMQQETYAYTGAWDFEIEMAIDESKTQVQEVNETNENGIGIASVEKTPFELKINEIYPNEETYGFPIALDANGEILPSGEGNVNTYAVQDRDTSTVYVYICDQEEYLDELKRYYFSDTYEENKKEKTFKELLDERALYKTEVHFE